MNNPELIEQVYYDRKGVKITDKGCNARGDFYTFTQIISYEIKVNPPDRKAAIGFILAGVLLIIVGIGIVFIGVGIWLWFKQKGNYWIIFETKEIKRDVVYQTYDLAEAQDITTALDVAIANQKI